jgi:uncharacterized membrane protein YbhN (UPF0104 family)
MAHRSVGTRATVWRRAGILAAMATAFLAVGPLARIPARLLAACGGWVALAMLLELLSMLGFVTVFGLVFGGGWTRRQRLGIGLRALGAITVLPAGGLVGPAMAARTGSAEPVPLPVLTRSTVALTILTTAPSLLALGGLGLSLWLGWPGGPRCVLLTVVPGALALAVVGSVLRLGRSSRLRNESSGGRTSSGRRGRVLAAALHCRGGAADARRLVADGHWTLVGAIGYYAFDNAVLWAAFHAFGPTPAISVIVMGYLVGSLGAVLPVPGGFGALEGGLIGALVLYGAPAAPAAGAVVLYRGVSVSLPTVLGAAAWVCSTPRAWRRGKDRRRRCAA